MSGLDAFFVLLGGIAAGAINVVVGSGTLISFPVLLAVGFSPVPANIANSVGLVPGSLVGAWGYRRELAGRRSYVARLAIASIAGGALGAGLLLTLPASAFKAIVPVFIVGALLLVVMQPLLSRRLAARDEQRATKGATVALFLCGVYGGYFGAAQGIIILAVLGFLAHRSLQHANAVKNVLAGVTNLVSGIVFTAAAHVDWEAAGFVAVGATIGGFLGARVGRGLSPRALRGLIVAVGCMAIVRLVA